MDVSKIRTVTFDCYGTLIDWEGGIGAFLYQIALRNGDTNRQTARRFQQEWEAMQEAITPGDYQPFHTILTESLHRWEESRGYHWNPTDGPAFADAMRSWQPFPDTIPALRQVREAGLRLVIISNTDRDIIEHSLRHLEVPFDAVITSEDCRAYKPALSVFEQARETIGEMPERLLHVAYGWSDIPPAHQLGWRTAWVNRCVEATPGEVQPDAIWHDLWGLATFVGGRGPRIPA